MFINFTVTGPRGAFICDTEDIVSRAKTGILMYCVYCNICYIPAQLLEESIYPLL